MLPTPPRYARSPSPRGRGETRPPFRSNENSPTPSIGVADIIPAPGLDRPRSALRTGLAYLLCALASTLVNLLVQEAAHRALGGAVVIPMLAGTAAGFAAKYALDKAFVFEDAYRGGTSEARKIALYGGFSVGTTLVFWGTELAFWQIWQTPQARYAGAVLGLAIGYAAKYRLDRAFVFRDRPA